MFGWFPLLIRQWYPFNSLSNSLKRHISLFDLGVSQKFRSEGLGGRRSHATQASCNPVIFNDFQAKDPLADSKTEQGPYYLYCTLYCFILNWAFNNIKDGSCCSMANVSYVSITSWVELMSDLNKLQNNTFFPQENVCTVETIIHTDQYVSVIY